MGNGLLISVVLAILFHSGMVGIGSFAHIWGFLEGKKFIIL